VAVSSWIEPSAQPCDGVIGLTLARRGAGRRGGLRGYGKGRDGRRFGVGVVGVQRVTTSVGPSGRPHSRMAMARGSEASFAPWAKGTSASRSRLSWLGSKAVVATKRTAREALHQHSHCLDRIARRRQGERGERRIRNMTRALLRCRVQSRGHLLDGSRRGTGSSSVEFHRSNPLSMAGATPAQLLSANPPFSRSRSVG